MRLPRKTGMKRCRNTPKFQRCVKAVAKREGGGKKNYNPYAVCTASVCRKWVAP
jgi:hypothetical protein